MLKGLPVFLSLGLLSACGSTHTQSVDPQPYNASRLLSEKIAKEVKAYPGVRAVTSVVQGNDITIGIDSKEPQDLSVLQWNLENKLLGFNISVIQEDHPQL